jgi:hypothetical protein
VLDGAFEIFGMKESEMIGEQPKLNQREFDGYERKNRSSNLST